MNLQVTTVTHKCPSTRVGKKSLAKNYRIYLIMLIFTSSTQDTEKESKFYYVLKNQKESLKFLKNKGET